MIGTTCPDCGSFGGRCSRPLPPNTIVNGEEATSVAYYRCNHGHLWFIIWANTTPLLMSGDIDCQHSDHVKNRKRI